MSISTNGTDATAPAPGALITVQDLVQVGVMNLAYAPNPPGHVALQKKKPETKVIFLPHEDGDVATREDWDGREQSLPCVAHRPRCLPKRHCLKRIRGDAPGWK